MTRKTIAMFSASLRKDIKMMTGCNDVILANFLLNHVIEAGWNSEIENCLDYLLEAFLEKKDNG